MFINCLWYFIFRLKRNCIYYLFFVVVLSNTQNCTERNTILWNDLFSSLIFTSLGLQKPLSTNIGYCMSHKQAEIIQKMASQNISPRRFQTQHKDIFFHEFSCQRFITVKRKPTNYCKALKQKYIATLCRQIQAIDILKQNFQDSH